MAEDYVNEVIMCGMKDDEVIPVEVDEDGKLQVVISSS